MKQSALVLLLVACTAQRRAVENGLIAFPRGDAANRQQLFTIHADGTGLTQLTFDGESSLPSWSPDGTQLVFVTREPNQPPEMRIANADGTAAHALGIGDAPSWGPDGKIAYCTGSPPEIYVVDAAGGAPTQLTHGGIHRGRIHPSWSADGSRVVYMELEPQDPSVDDTSNGCPAIDTQPELWSVAADGSDPRQLTWPGSYNVDASGATINSAFDANAPSSSPTDDTIVFWSGQEQCYGQVWRMAADGSHRTQLTHQPIPSRNDDPHVSPDGAYVLFSTDRRGRPELWMMNADGTDEHFLAANHPGPGPGDAAWQPLPDGEAP